ncbi:MAG: Ig-like domain repeat protein, partial [Bifidobacteriaceae bacterium]|nr:Ig-like domain repeat protein [Bifidobacteriaceae bacterium]
MMHMRGRTRLVAAVATVGVTLATISTTALQAAHADPLPLGPSVIRTGTAPTGYEVTFNLSAPSATTVEIYGEWSFAAPVAPGSDTLAAPHGPSAWAPGDVLSGGAWWSDSMTDADLDGVWTVTMPLPPGAYSYGFYVDCPSHPGSCRVTDPANLPWSNQPAQIAASAAQQTMSQVFVPRDPQFADDDVAYLEPHSGPGGSLTEFTYSSPGATAPVGTHRAVVYTPPGYDPNRSLPYPTIYVSHGGSGNETDWVTQGQADVIVDNAIKSGRLQPSLAVFTDFNGLPNGVDGYRNDVIRNLIPAIEGAYNVSSDPASRAIAGLSAGSQRVINIIENEPAVFDYYGPWSSGGNPGAAVLTDQVKADMAGIAEIYSGVGFQDNEPSRPRADYLAERMGSYRDQIPGLKVTEHYIPGVHSWDVWRQLLNGFLRDSVFRATTVQASTPVATVATGAPVALNANVAAWTASTSVPTGTVAFYANGDATTGDKVGEGTLQSDGTVVATGRFTQVGSAVPVVAIYGGDDAHESAAAAPFTINVVPANSSGGLALGANVRYTGQAPTGYEVTFRYEAPDSVSSVAIFGEWYFSDPASIVSQATADMRLGADWREGDVLSGRNNSWRAEPMAKGTDGIWEFTTALPSGTFSYRFYHNCIPQAPNFTCSGSGYVDPTNIPWSNTAANQTAGANQQSLSQVYVPSSVRYPTYDNDYQAPALSGQEGTVQTFRYYSWQTRAIRNVSVYLPAEYDPNRPVPYPTLYLEAGGAGVGTDWLTQGVAQNIVGNAIRSGTVQPMVVVTPNTTGLPAGNPNGTQFIPEMRESVIPAIERDFNVSTDPADRALAGLSMGGARTAYTLQHSTDLFGYYGIWSPGGAYTDVPDATQGAEMAKALGIQIAAGQQDYLSDIRTETVRRIADYRALGVEVTERLVPGIHSWDFWRSTLDVFLSDMAFKKTVTEVSPVTGARAWLPVTLSATVTSLSTTALAPSGTVAFHLGSATGEKLGEAPVGANGVASVSTVVRAAGTVPVVAVYSGDAVLNGSTSDPTDIAVAAGPNNPLRLGPTVSHTGSAPTGYEVTFRYQAPDSVSSVQIYGEWYFSQPASVVSQTTSDMRMGANWQSGDILAGYSNAWRAVQMAKGTDGIWEFTTPLPSGTFSYRYYHNCSAVNGSGCAAIVDPNNLPWSNRTAQIAAGAAPQALSQVYVPSSPEYPTYDNDFQAPLAVGHEGALTSLRYHSTATGTTRNVSVWVPEGYDANRAIPYPTLYISHGAGGSDTDWMTQGMAQNIVGNAIAGGFAQDMVVVASNFNGLPGGNVGLAQDIRDSIIPAIEGQYNVSHEAKDRAFAGLSAGGARAASALHETTDVFGYYGIWSPAGAYTAPTAEQLSKMREVLGLQIGAGVQDYLGNINTGTQNRINAYRALGLEVVERMIPGIHSWDYWRGALDEFVKDVAFMTTGVHVNPVAGAKAWLPVTLSATVSPRSTAAAAPTGTVAFYVGSPDGEKLGEAQVGSDGTATISTVFSMFGLVPVVAVYSGDALLNGSTSESTSVMVAAGPSNPLRLGPTVKRTGTAPTGYEVTFRYQAPDSVASVQIYGEWYFSQPSSIVSQTTSDMRMGADWQSGDILAGYNNAWRAVQMTKGTDGIWEYTTPLPSGTFSYRFYHDCAAVNGSGCQARLDPANTPWSNETAQVAAGASQQTLSQVYVPQSTEYPTYDND